MMYDVLFQEVIIFVVEAKSAKEARAFFNRQLSYKKSKKEDQ